MAASQLNGLVNSGELTTGCAGPPDQQDQNNNILPDPAAAAQAIVVAGHPKGEPLPNSAGGAPARGGGPSAAAGAPWRCRLELRAAA